MTRKLIGTLKQLRATAKEYGIKGRSKMSRDELQKELWNHIYGKDFLPSNRSELVEFLMFHPDKLVRDMQHTWMCYGGKSIVDALNVVVRSVYSATTEEGKEESEKYKFPGVTQAFEDCADATIACTHHYISELSEHLEEIEEVYWKERHLEKYEGDVLFLVNLELRYFVDNVKLPFKLHFGTSKPRPVGTIAWICLHSTKELAQATIKSQWEYDPVDEVYWVSRENFVSLRNRLEVAEVSGELAKSI
jgi:hypothetical protein